MPRSMKSGIPEIGSPNRNQREDKALERGRELLHEHEGSIRDALHFLGEELREELRAEAGALDLNARDEIDYAREYQRKLVRYVEECWATAVLR